MFSDIMSHDIMSHDQARGKVCCVCLNRRGSKACRGVTEEEEEVVRANILSDFNSSSEHFPSGVCKGCIFDLRKLRCGGEVAAKVKLQLPKDYNCYLPRSTRATANITCTCRWCQLGRMYGLELRRWKKEVSGKPGRGAVERLCPTCFVGVLENKSHTCCPTKVEAVRNLVATLPHHLKEQVALEILREEVGESGDRRLSLTPARGGRRVSVTLGIDSPLPMEVLSHEEVIVMATNAHLTGTQTVSVMADIRNKFGRKVVESHLKPALTLHNNKLAGFFKTEVTIFTGKDNTPVERAVLYCPDSKAFLSHVAELRGQVLEEINVLVGGDSGQGFFKLASSLIEDTKQEVEGKRRTREQGICSGDKFLENGARKILLLFVCETIPESADNLGQILHMVQVNQLDYRLMGDFKFLMPCVCLMPCSSLNPCLFCPQRRDGKGEWSTDEVHLRTLGGNQWNWMCWVNEGSREGAAHTSKWESCAASDLLVLGKGDSLETLVLDKIIMPSCHLLLSYNTLLKAVGKVWPALKGVLYQLFGVKAHDYHGKEADFEGPQCRKILKDVEQLAPYMDKLKDKELIMDAFLAFKLVNELVFGTKLGEGWREALYSLRTALLILHTSTISLPITPKLHVLMEHVETWVDRNKQSLGTLSEQALEASHHFFKRTWEHYKVKDVTTEAYLHALMQASIKFNADNI